MPPPPRRPSCSLRSVLLASAAMLAVLEAVGIVLQSSCHRDCLMPRNDSQIAVVAPATCLSENATIGVSCPAHLFSGAVARMIESNEHLNSYFRGHEDEDCARKIKRRRENQSNGGRSDGGGDDGEEEWGRTINGRQNGFGSPPMRSDRPDDWEELPNMPPQPGFDTGMTSVRRRRRRRRRTHHERKGRIEDVLSEVAFTLTLTPLPKVRSRERFRKMQRFTPSKHSRGPSFRIP